MDLISRFLDYVKFNTQSDENSNTIPSSNNQLLFAEKLAVELNELGLSDISLNNGYLMATLPATPDTKRMPCIGFIAHLDTSPDVSGENIQPQIVKNYRGQDILLNKEKSTVLSPDVFPELKNYVGQDIITTDGNTLLGSDDKAGIAEIITAMEYLINHPELKHGKIRIAFTPDEEIGKGADLFDVKNFGAEWAYTVDGGEIGELEYENFNASMATITILGQNVHPGYAKNKMINSIDIARKFESMIPEKERPEKTEYYEGFFHLIDIKGSVDKTVMRYILRDFDYQGLKKRENVLESCALALNRFYEKTIVSVQVKEQYKNMKEIIDQNMHIIDLAKQAMINVGVTPKIKPIRGGTDGSRLSFMNLPCPNIFAGGHNFHSRYEFIPVQSMHKAMETIIQLSILEK